MRSTSLSMQTFETYLTAHRERFIRELCEYLRIPTVSAQPAHQADMARGAAWIADQFRRAGLKADIHPTAGHPIVLAATPSRPGRRKPRYLVYGHYDVQPPEPLELWQSPPFEPRIENNRVFARGACDNKGQHLAHLKAVEAWRATRGELPCDLVFLIEGEEEIGSPHLAPFLRARHRELRCDAVVISDTSLVSPRHPTLCYALRGICALEVTLRGPSRDLHSGLFGGSLDNPAMALCQMLAALRDRRGRVAIPGFYDDVRKLSAFERRAMARQPFNAAAYRKFLGVPALFGEAGFSPVEQRSARPTLEINGLTSGYQGEGSKTIVPAWARAKLTLRLVPDQKPAAILKAVARHLKSLCPPTVRMDIEFGHSGDPYLVAPEGPQVQAGLRALRRAFGHEPVLIREGGSIPIVNDFRRILGVDTLLLGLALPDDNAHSPNEKFDLGIFEKGIRMGACLWEELTGTSIDPGRA